MKKRLTTKQEEIVTLIPQFRFLNRVHIQILLNHKDEARINKWLTGLVLNQYLNRLYDSAIIGKNRVPAVYFLNNLGVRYIKNQGMYDEAVIHKLYWDKGRSESFINHCLLTATICCELETKQNKNLTFEYTTVTDFSNGNHTFHFLKETKLDADLVFSKKEKGKRKIKYFLLSIFDETLPRYRIRSRMRKYKEFYFSNIWENNTGISFPTILFVFQTKERMIYAKRYAKTILAETDAKDLSFHFATGESVKTSGVTGQIWETV